MSRFGCVSTRAWQTTLKRLTGGGESSLPSRRRWTVCGSSTTQRSDESDDGAAAAAVRDGEDVCAAGTSAEETAGEVGAGTVFDAAGDRACGEEGAGGKWERCSTQREIVQSGKMRRAMIPEPAQR